MASMSLHNTLLSFVLAHVFDLASGLATCNLTLFDSAVTLSLTLELILHHSDDLTLVLVISLLQNLALVFEFALTLSLTLELTLEHAHALSFALSFIHSLVVSHLLALALAS